MPIDIPSDKSNNPQLPRSNKVEATATANIQTKQSPLSDGAIVRAVVSEVVNANQQKAQAQATAANTQAQKALYDAIITLNQTQAKTTSGSSNNLPPITQLDANTLQQISSGKPIAVRVQTNAPLQVGQQLKVQLQGQALKLMQIAPPDLKGVLQQFIRQEVNQQNSYALLLSKLMSIAQAIRQHNNSTQVTGQHQPQRPTNSTPVINTPASNTPSKGDAKPNAAPIPQPSINANKAQPNVQSLKPAIDRFMEALPNLKMVSNSEGLKQAIKNSGVFFEKNLLNPSLSGTKSTSNNAGSNLLIQQIKQQIKQLKIAIQSQPAAPTNSAKPQLNQNNVATDLKLNLLTLQRQLESLEKQLNNNIATKASGPKTNNDTISNMPNASDAATAAKKVSTEQAQTIAAPAVKTDKSIASSQISTPGQDPKIAKQSDSPLPINSDAKAKQINQQKMVENLSKDNIARDNVAKDKLASDNAATAQLAKSSSPVYQRPTANHSQLPGVSANTSASSHATSGTDPTKPKSITELVIQPPLPGKPFIQTQAVRPQALAKESLADALISVLIKHTKEATSRLNLHQLTSVAESTRQDGGPPQTNLSFELPIVNGNDLALFQFRIQEEELDGHEGKESQGKEKKWVVHMGFDLEGLGPMYCQITLIGVSASVTFWAEEKTTVSQSKQHIEELRGKLSNLGVNVKEIQCLEGSPPTDQSGIKQTLIDIET